MKNRSVIPSDDWATPPSLIKTIEEQFGYFFDPCPWHNDLSRWDGLTSSWNEFNYVNPPFSTPLKRLFIEKAIEEHKKGFATLMLLPSATDTKDYHDLILPNQSVRETHLRGRPNFIGKNTKGQYVNYHLIKDVNKNSMILFKEKKGVDIEIKRLPKYIKANGQNAYMLVFFDGGQKFNNLEEKLRIIQNYKYE